MGLLLYLVDFWRALYYNIVNNFFCEVVYEKLWGYRLWSWRNAHRSQGRTYTGIWIRPSKNENRIIDDVNPVEVKDKEIPVLSNEEDDTYDIQKELEEKFDELFGPME